MVLVRLQYYPKLIATRSSSTASATCAFGSFMQIAVANVRARVTSARYWCMHRYLVAGLLTRDLLASHTVCQGQCVGQESACPTLLYAVVLRQNFYLLSFLQRNLPRVQAAPITACLP